MFVLLSLEVAHFSVLLFCCMLLPAVSNVSMAKHHNSTIFLYTNSHTLWNPEPATTALSVAAVTGRCQSWGAASLNIICCMRQAGLSITLLWRLAQTNQDLNVYWKCSGILCLCLEWWCNCTLQLFLWCWSMILCTNLLKLVWKVERLWPCSLCPFKDT